MVGAESGNRCSLRLLLALGEVCSTARDCENDVDDDGEHDDDCDDPLRVLETHLSFERSRAAVELERVLLEDLGLVDQQLDLLTALQNEEDAVATGKRIG